jgi:peptide/nickel transport system substrate-binding protein
VAVLGDIHESNFGAVLVKRQIISKEDFMKNGRLTKMLLLAAIASLAVVVACGGGDADPTSPPAQQPTSAPATSTAPTPTTPPQATVVPTATVKAAPTAVQATTAPTSSGSAPSGKLTLALPSVGSPIFVNGLAPFPRGLFRSEWGICETLAAVDTDDTTKVISRLAESWVVAPDQSKMTFTLREGVQFHKGNGEMTAEDVAFSYNNAGADNPESTAGGGASLLSTWDAWYADGDYTVVAPFDTPEPLASRWGFINGGADSGHCILSKSVYDSVGEEAAVTTMVATGPWDAQVWEAGVELKANAVEDHWRITPGFAEMHMLEVPEEQTRVAMIRTGQADIAQAALKSIKGLVEDGFEANATLRNFYHAAVFVGGNFWYDPAIHTFQDEPVNTRAGFKPDDDHPWIGDPTDPVRHERARKVRQAMSLALDRTAISETILGGLAPVSYIPGIPVSAPDWDDKWVVPFDPEEAKSLLAEAGYADGFEFDFWIPNDFPNVDVEVAQAIAAMWENVGIRANQNTISYTAGRPNLMTKEQDAPWMWFMVGDGINYDSAHVRTATYNAHGPGWNGAIEIPELASFQNRYETLSGDRDAQIEVFKERADWLRQWMPFITVADVPKLWVTNPDTVTGWTMYSKAEPGTVNNLEIAQPVN